MKKSPQKVQTAIEAYQVEAAKNNALLEAHQTALDKLNEELAEVKVQLVEAVEETITEPSANNVQVETNLNRRVKELESDIKATQERAVVARSVHSGTLGQLAETAIHTGREEAQRYCNENWDAKIKAIEEAKYAYLSALVDLHELRNEAYSIYGAAVNGTNSESRAERLPKPHFPELALNWRGGERQVHGISETEAMRAYRDGKIRRTSVAPGREIE